MGLNRVGLPAEVANVIIAKTQTESAVAKLARKITIPGRGLAVPVITGDPQASWVGEGAQKPVSNAEVTSKLLQPYKLAVIETFSKELARDQKALYDALVERLPKALAQKFDNTVINGAAPGANFDTFAAATAQSIANGEYDALVGADGDVANNGGVLNGFILSPQGKSAFLGAKDTLGRPIFTMSATQGLGGQLIGADTVISKGAYKAVAGGNDILGVGGDFSQAVVGTVNDVEISVSDEATLTLPDGSTVNLFQNNMIAVLAEIEIGFRADVASFDLITA